MKKKLIEVALPLEAINKASAREKSIRHGHPSTLHLWWARRPLAACRAVLFASLVDDPSSRPEKFDTQEKQEEERRRLFGIIEDLVRWENSNNATVLERAKKAILDSTDGNPPPILDPFCGGGSIPLEAQRLGLKAHASDLNPVAVLITKALIEIPPKFAGKPPVNPDDAGKTVPGEVWKGASGLAADVRYYGTWMRDEAKRRIGHLYPKVTLPANKGGGEATVIAWLWARTVKCPNPACGAQMPLVRSFWLSKKDRKKAWVQPVVDKDARTVSFDVHSGDGSAPDGTVNRRGARCIICESPVDFHHIRAEGRVGRLCCSLMAIVAEGNRARTYVSPQACHETVASTAEPESVPDSGLPERALGFRVQVYGMTKHRDLFTSRQLVALTTFSDLVGEAREKVLKDARASGMADDGTGIDEGGIGATAYADAVATYLAFAVDRLAMTGNSLVRWNPVGEKAQHAFGRQALPMVWDFAEPNFFATATGSIDAAIKLTCDPLLQLGSRPGSVGQLDATCALMMESPLVVCTDPPYYDNIGYADLSDFFFVWLRRSLYGVYPSLFATMLTPKKEELIASPYRHDDDRRKAENFFEVGLRESFSLIRSRHSKYYPFVLFYAFKQAETESNGDVTSTGWETMLEGLLNSGFAITATWPVRTEMKTRQVAMGTSALSSSIVLACRPRPADAGLTTRRDFLNELKRELPSAVRMLQQGNIAPVDLAQAAVGPGMAIFSKYTKVVESDGKPMTIRTALGLINQALDEVLAEQESEYDPDTRWALAWFEQSGTEEGPFGVAEILSRAKNTSIDGLVRAGILASHSGKVRLLKRHEYKDDWDPSKDERLTVWEVTQHLIRALDAGEDEAGKLARKVGAMAETARDLAYRLYVVCERKKWAREALAYNRLVVAWPQIRSVAGGAPAEAEQKEIFE